MLPNVGYSTETSVDAGKRFRFPEGARGGVGAAGLPWSEGRGCRGGERRGCVRFALVRVPFALALR